MPARWLFVLVFLAYLMGPSRAPAQDAGERLAAIVAQPMALALRAVYPAVPASDRERWTGRILCALCAAAAIALTFVTLRQLAALEGALLLAVSAAFASPLWSWTSRADLPGALATLFVAALLWLTVSRPESLLADVTAGALAGALMALHPASVLAPLLLVAFVRNSAPTGRTLLLSLAGAAAAALLLRPALPDRFAAFDATVALAYLVSPGRGLLFFVPVALLALLALARGEGPRRFVFGGALVVLAVLAELAASSEPWGALGFGPTLLAPFVPLLAVMAARLPRPLLRAGAVLSLPAMFAHGASVFLAGHTWDERRSVAQHPAAFWDLEDSPWSDLVSGPPRPDPTQLSAAGYLLTPGEHLTRRGVAMPWLAYGWETAEPNGTWAAGRESWIVLATPPGGYVLTLTATAASLRGRPQRVIVERPDDAPLEVGFSKELWDLEPLRIPFKAVRNVTVLKLRPAHTWIPGRGDARRLSLFLGALHLQRAPAGGERLVELETELGSIQLAVDTQRAPKTAANFLRYVDGGHYEGGVFHRTVKRDNQPDKKVRIEVVQAGIDPARKQEGFGPIALERTRDTGLDHRDGTLSMARDGPDTATSDFFLCIGDQPSLDFGGARNPDGQGFAAFGRVVAGMDVVRKIQAAPAEGQRLTPPVRILKARRR